MAKEIFKQIRGIILLFFIVAALAFGGFAILPRFTHRDVLSSKTKSPTVTIQPASSSSQIDTFSYAGVKGKNALELLKNNATVKFDSSGMVVSINGREADTTRHEYWAFYINGDLANIGPASYMTSDGDILKWKIEKY